METKFKAGDVIVRRAYKKMKSPFLRDEMRVMDVVSDGHPICPQMWYVCEHCSGRIDFGIVSVVDEAFVLN